MTDNSFFIAGSRPILNKDEQGLVRIEHVRVVKIWRQEQNERCEKKRHFSCFILLVEGKMRLNCEILIANRSAPSHNMRNASKPTRASLAIGRKETSKHVASENRNAAVFLLVCTAKERNGAKYKVCARQPNNSI